jgi:iron complex outermembrane recepter protein
MSFAVTKSETMAALPKIYLSLLLAFLSICIQAQTGIIDGIIQTSDGCPAEYVVVMIVETKQGATTNDRGEYRITNVPVGKYTLKTLSVGLETKEQEVIVKANETTQVEVITLSENSQTLREIVISAKRKNRFETSENFNRLPLKNLENPQSVQVINETLMRDRQIQSVGEALKSMAGVNAFSSSQYSDYVMRGFRGSPGNFAYNGIRGDFYQFDQASLTYNLESIEVIKGPASVLYSAGNPGGIINHVTKKPLLTPRYELQYTLGSFNQHRVMTDATGPVSKNQRLLYRLIIGYENTGQLDENLDIRNIFLAPQLQYKIGNESTLNYEFNYANDNRTMGFNRGTPALFNSESGNWTLDRFPANTSLIDPNGKASRNTFSHQLTFVHGINKQTRITALFRTLISKTFQADLSPGAWGIGAVNDSIPLENRYWNEDLYNHQLSTFLTFESQSKNRIKHTAVIGIDANLGGRTAEYAGFEERIVSVLNPEFGWGLYSQDAIYNQLASATYQSGWKEETILLATYFQDQISISEKIKILLGGRVETHNYETYYFDLDTRSETFRDSLDAVQFLPRAGFVYKTSPSSSIYYGYFQGFQPQWGSNTGAGGPFAPEKSRQHEVGFKKEWMNNKLITTLALYHIQKLDVLAPDPSDADGIRLIQISNVYSKGIELSVQGKILESIDINANYTYNEATTPGDAGYDYFPAGWFPNAPNTNVNLWTKYKFQTGPLKRVGVGAGFNYLSKRSTYTPGFEIPEFSTIDATINYQISGLNLSANIYNITNTRYWNGAYGPSNLWPGNPRSFRFTVVYVF